MNEHHEQAVGHPPTTFLFLHMPKAGGTTVTRLLLSRFPVDRRHRLTGVDPGEAIENFLRLEGEVRANLRLICGHLYYGFHEHIPNPCVYMTMLREPVDRVMSHYYYAASWPAHSLHEAARDMPLADFVASGCSGDVENTQAKLLSGAYRDFRPQGVFRTGEPISDADLLTRAKRNLERFGFVGVYECFAESLVLMGRCVGWRGPFVYRSENVTSARLSRDEIDPETLRVIEDRNQLDQEVYRTARRRFEETAARLGWSFTAHARWLRTLDGARRLIGSR